MKQYLSFISNDHLLECIKNLHQSYISAKQIITKKTFYSNKVDIFKLLFDSKFNDVSEEQLINLEIIRQIDKSINNSIGTFHEQILGGIKGFDRGNLSGFDIKATDDTLFADIKNKHNTMNSSSAEALFQKLAQYANTYKSAKCFWVQILAKSSFCELWKGEINGKEYSHSRVYKISGDKFYALLTGTDDAMAQLYKVLPQAIEDYLKTVNSKKEADPTSVLSEINQARGGLERTLLDQITYDNYPYYKGFESF